MPGSGKTWMMRALEKELCLEVQDLDHYFEKYCGMTIGQFWKQYGQKEFRSLERYCMMELLESQVSIIAMGGGTPCFFNNIEIIKDLSFSIYLKMNPIQLESQIDPNSRPLFDGILIDTNQINTLYQQRRAWYERADRIIVNNFYEPNVLDDVKMICRTYFQSHINK